MKSPRRSLLLIIPVLLLLGGCADSHDAAMQDSIDLLNEMVDIIESVKDEESAKAMEKKMERLSGKMKALQERMDKLGEPSPEKKAELKKKYEPKQKEAGARMVKAMMNLATKPELAQQIDKVMKNIHCIKVGICI